MLARMKKLVEELSRASEAYYKYDKPIMTDKAYDKLYDEWKNWNKKQELFLPILPHKRCRDKFWKVLKGDPFQTNAVFQNKINGRTV
ncbi:MAG: hypothetical protein ACLSCV_09760 [Acutalibacteraceae bacterium]